MKKILCIHGIGGKDASMESWSLDWKKSIIENSGFEEEEIDFNFLKIDDLFTQSKERLGQIKYIKAIGLFISSWVTTSVEERYKGKGFLDTINWYAGMPAQFATDDVLRKDLKKLIDKTIQEYKPEIIFAHSLGTLICYDYFREKTVQGESFPITLITAGSQIGHPAMRQLFGGAIMPLNVKFWVNLHNEKDMVFASRSISINSDKYLQVETQFKLATINHDAVGYLNHDNTVNQAWPIIIKKFSTQLSREVKLGQLGISSFQKSSQGREPNRKALLIGINDYPEEQNRLYGCVNDVFRMSEVLQEYGFVSDEIVVTINERATAKNIRSRLEWLLGDAKEGDLRFLFYSGHGAQIPSPHSDYELDTNDECLVPYDFDWTVENAYTDKEFLQLYSQLSLDVDFVSVFDCCHSGGMTRGNGTKSRGLTPPDDIRHREIKWDMERQMWIPRDLNLKKEKLFNKTTKDKALYNGENGKTNKLGRAMPLWSEVGDFEKAKSTYGTVGPYMPIILEACEENELAYEYKHGVTSYGAFTYSITTILRQMRAKGKPILFENLMKATSEQLKELKYDQKPVLFGPKVKIDRPLPFRK